MFFLPASNNRKLDLALPANKKIKNKKPAKILKETLKKRTIC